MQHTQSQHLFQQAQQIIPGGVNSPVRSFKSVGLTPIYIDRAKGSRIWDVDGNEYIDCVGSWGPLILGHADDDVVNAITDAAQRGTSFGACHKAEIEMAEQICTIFPSIEKVRMVNSGTEATMSAIRLARGYTKRNKIIKFEGCYHGHADSFLIKAGSGLITLGHPSSPGVTPLTAGDTLIAQYNDISSVQHLVDEFPNQIAAIILEPIMGNMGLILPKNDFLQKLRDICNYAGIVLIFDEVITGFRVALGGAQQLYNVKPDITCLGKIIGGGLPVGAFGGKAEIMNCLAPDGPVYQAGTLAGNPLAMAAGLAMLKKITQPNFYKSLEEKGAYLEKGIRNIFTKHSKNYTFHRIGSMSCLFFTDSKIDTFQQALNCDKKAYARYFKLMLEAGIYIAPAQFEVSFLSSAHTFEDIDILLSAIEKALTES